MRCSDHHQDQADGNRDVGRPHGNGRVKALDSLGRRIADQYADRHGEKDPEGQVAVEEREFFL